MKKTDYEPGELVLRLGTNNKFIILEKIKSERLYKNCWYRVYDIMQKKRAWFFHDELFPF
mgnify:CR=1 FL=1